MNKYPWINTNLQLELCNSCFVILHWKFNDLFIQYPPIGNHRADLIHGKHKLNSSALNETEGETDSYRALGVC